MPEDRAIDPQSKRTRAKGVENREGAESNRVRAHKKKNRTAPTVWRGLLSSSVAKTKRSWWNTHELQQRSKQQKRSSFDLDRLRRL